MFETDRNRTGLVFGILGFLGVFLGGDSMILTFDVPQIAKGQERFDIDSLKSRKTQKSIKKMGNLGMAKLDR